MATATEGHYTSSLPPDRSRDRIVSRIIPPPPSSAAMPSSSGDAMDVSPAHTPPAINTSPSNHNDYDSKLNGRANHSPPHDASSSSASMPAPPPSAAGAAQQPKIVQTAFIHKLYNMLEDSQIQHLISWSATAESFVMSPTADFSKVLSQYFKHTNISSFVRQLNMYGFHKERDVFHTGNPDTTLWEFKHGNGNFKRGDIAGLREIKRRASKQLGPKENTYVKATSSQPGTPAEPVQLPPESTDARLAHLEHSIYDMSNRLHRSEEQSHYLQLRNQASLDTVSRLLQFNQDMSRMLLSLIPADSATHRDVVALQSDLQRQVEFVRTFEETSEPPYSVPRSYLGNMDNAPVSPRQLPQDDSRRTAPGITQLRAQPSYRPLVSSNLTTSSRRFGSIGGSSPNQSSPLRNAAPPPPPAPHLLSVHEPPGMGMGRRHTAADIRAHGWQTGAAPYPSSNPPSAPWPSSPNRVPVEDQRIRESLSAYSLQGASHAHPRSRPTTPPPPTANGVTNGHDAFAGWGWNSTSSRDGRGPPFKDSSAPATRRGSMAHILNPSNTENRSDEDDDMRLDEDRKRKRLQ
ncbi:flocculation suppression protein [Beauveria brongniartii RCEF 3172]|uniref:Flocculation suppression protein n=1 Tax=Beauveria brongniartii RCEF 3172 TaxID=1081107 RepID=A0A167HMI3_9HYPO|nr:flocculation suppression protein [Beauveria brongniartii RCEF 3172]